MRYGEIEIPWGDSAAMKFRLAIGQLQELQHKTNCGPLELLRRFTSGTWRIDDLRETIRLGLIGGGKTPVEALHLLRVYVDERPLVESVAVAQAALAVVLIGDEEEDKKKVGEEKGQGSEKGQTVGSPLPPSTDKGQSSDLHPNK